MLDIGMAANKLKIVKMAILVFQECRASLAAPTFRASYLHLVWWRQRLKISAYV